MSSTSTTTPLVALFGLLAYNALAAIEPSIVALMHQVGERHLVAGRNPISFCNVLFISQIVSLVTFLALFHRDLTRENFRKITRRKWHCLFSYVVLGSVITQMLYFFSLDYTSVASIVLISSMQIPLAAFVNAWLFREVLERRQMGGHVLIFAGIVTPFLLATQASMFSNAGWGDMLAFFAMLCGVANGIFAKYLSDLPLGVIGVVASGASAVFFFCFASLYFGPEHFQDLLVPYVWELVFVYAIVLVVSRHIIRQLSFRRASNQAINTISASYPALAVIAAYLIASQIPTYGQTLGVVLVVAGILFAIAPGTRKGFLEKQVEGERAAVRVNA